MRGSAGTGLIRNLIIARFAATSDGAAFAPSRSSLGKVRLKSASTRDLAMYTSTFGLLISPARAIAEFRSSPSLI